MVLPHTIAFQTQQAGMLALCRVTRAQEAGASFLLTCSPGNMVTTESVFTALYKVRQHLTHHQRASALLQEAQMDFSKARELGGMGKTISDHGGRSIRDYQAVHVHSLNTAYGSLNAPK